VPESMIREVIQDWSLVTIQKGPDKVRAFLKNAVNKIIVNPDYSIAIQLKIVCLELVPRTRVSLNRHIIFLAVWTENHLNKKAEKAYGINSQTLQSNDRRVFIAIIYNSCRNIMSYVVFER
jgi:hypothetical protein